MKGLIVLMCALVAVQARSTAVSNSAVRAAAALGENPWLVHLRIAVSTSGLLETCAGSLIHSSWVLTASSCVSDVRFVWIRYGAINVINPELVTEASISRPGDNVGLININRVVEFTSNIAAVALPGADAEAPETATYCTYSDAEENVPDVPLNCISVDLEAVEDGLVANVKSTVFDLGAPLVKDGVQVGVLIGSADGVSTFARPENYLEWIEEQTGVDFSSDVDAVVADSDATKVIFVN